LQSISGRWNALNPGNRTRCPFTEVTGLAVSTRLILVKELDCGQVFQTANVLVNIELSNPADTVQMVTARRVAVKGVFKIAREYRAAFGGYATYMIAEKAGLVAGDPLDRSAPPPPAFTSYMMCQPPEMDALAAQLRSELCVQSTLLENLAATRPALELAVRTPAKLSPGDTVSGDRDAISCRLDPGLSGLHLQAIACARGSYWAWYHAGWNVPSPKTPAPP